MVTGLIPSLNYMGYTECANHSYRYTVMKRDNFLFENIMLPPPVNYTALRGLGPLRLSVPHHVNFILANLLSNSLKIITTLYGVFVELYQLVTACTNQETDWCSTVEPP